MFGPSSSTLAALRVVEGGEKREPTIWVVTKSPCVRFDIPPAQKQGHPVSGLGVYRIWHRKIRVWPWVSRDSHARWTALESTSSNCKGQTRPSIRDGVPHPETPNCLLVTMMCAWAQNRDIRPRQIGPMTSGRNMTQSLIFELWFSMLKVTVVTKQRLVNIEKTFCVL
jgi:hypothetical protein